MKIYYVDNGHTHFFATLDDAKKAAREAATTGQDTTVDRCEIGNDKASIVALANGQTGKGVVVYTAKAKR